MPVDATPLAHARQHVNQRRWLVELAALLAFPTISALPLHRGDGIAAAHWLATHLRRIGLEHAAVLPGPNNGAPSIYAEWLHAPGKPTLLLYGHYDVQPPGPLAAWRTPPFRATRVGERLFARGASDDKGQLFIHLKALESYLATMGRLPLNVKVWLEGEEEIGSPNLTALLNRELERLRADAVLISDTEMPTSGRPAIISGLRGMAAFELEVRGPARDLHAGRYGGAVRSPLAALSTIIATFQDWQARVTIPGFYRRVRAIRSDERQLFKTARSDAPFLAGTGAPGPWGEAGYTPFERITARPALIVTHMSGGGPGVIPACARARFEVRLVPDQEPDEIAALVRRHITAVMPSGVQTCLRVLSGSRPVVLPQRHPVMTAAGRAVERVWGSPPIFTRSGGSIPLVEQLHRRLGVPVVLLGFGLTADQIHGANESLSLRHFFRGVETVIAFLAEYGA